METTLPSQKAEDPRPQIRGSSSPGLRFISHNADDYPAMMHAHSRRDGRHIPARQETDPSAFEKRV